MNAAVAARGDDEIPVVIRAKGLVKRYPGNDTPALDGLDLRVRAGEIFGLLGPNGAGKTTAIAIMTTLLRPDSGTLHLFDLDPTRKAREVRRLIGLVPQEIALYPTLTVAENLIYFGRLYGLNGTDLARRVDDCLTMVGLKDHSARRVAACSGGMKRRANLAAGILHQPKILFLDEPTVGIDAQSRSHIFAGLKRLQEAGTTLVYTTHYMEEAQQLCDRIVIIDAGRSLAVGAPAQLLAGAPSCGNLEQYFLQLTGRYLRD